MLEMYVQDNEINCTLLKHTAQLINIQSRNAR